jgi:glycosyltransferase involved in cell wall biosynthesis
VLSDALHDLYLRKYGIESTVIPHIVDDDSASSASARDLPPGVEPGRFALFSGDVYGMNADSLRRLVHVVKEGFRGRLQIVISGQKTKDELRTLGIEPNVVVVGTPRETLLALQKHAAVLLAPLAFDSPFPDDVNTALPTKVIEYLVAGPPILVHAPPGSFLEERASAGGWAAVVSSTSEEELHSTIARLLDDHDLRDNLGIRAREASRAYSAENAVDAFLAAMTDGVAPAASRE